MYNQENINIVKAVKLGESYTKNRTWSLCFDDTQLEDLIDWKWKIYEFSFPIGEDMLVHDKKRKILKLPSQLDNPKILRIMSQYAIEQALKTSVWYNISKKLILVLSLLSLLYMEENNNFART